ncbi:MAG: permease-like cell division protein FtsX [Firmicutes bacterium]|nr:permease-like cell division protein FtsX [Bacillota bacterium]
MKLARGGNRCGGAGLEQALPAPGESLRSGRLLFYLREALWAIRLHFGNNLLSIFSMALSLLFLIFVFLGLWNLQALVDQVRAEAQIMVYLKDEVTPAEQEAFRARLKSLPGVEGVKFLSQAGALARVQALLGPQATALDAFSGYNPFAAYFQVRVRPEDADRVAEAAASYPGVEAVANNQEVLARLVSLTAAVRLLGSLVTVAAGVMTMLIISHIVRLGLYGRREEIETYRLLGASEGFIGIPFFLEGSLLGGLAGLVAAFIALALVPQLAALLQRSLPFLPLPPWTRFFFSISWLIPGLGLVFGAVGSLLTLRSIP